MMEAISTAAFTPDWNSVSFTCVLVRCSKTESYLRRTDFFPPMVLMDRTAVVISDSVSEAKSCMALFFFRLSPIFPDSFFMRKRHRDRGRKIKRVIFQLTSRREPMAARV